MRVIESLKNLWSKLKNSNRVLKISLATLGVVAAVLLVGQLNNLFNFFGTKASEVDPEAIYKWQSAGVTKEGRSYQASAFVQTEINGVPRYYIYLLGGLQSRINVMGTGNLAGNLPVLSKTVERLEVKADGTPLTVNQQWEALTSQSMIFGRGAFKAVQVSNYLYAVAGHMSVLGAQGAGDTLASQVNDAIERSQIDSMPFSTIERLDVTNPNAQWELVGTMTNLNFLPEVTLTSDGKLHITGGVFGTHLDVATDYIGKGDLYTKIENARLISGEPLMINKSQPPSPACVAPTMILSCADEWRAYYQCKIDRRDTDCGTFSNQPCTAQTVREYWTGALPFGRGCSAPNPDFRDPTGITNPIPKRIKPFLLQVLTSQFYTTVETHIYTANPTTVTPTWVNGQLVDIEVGKATKVFNIGLNNYSAIESDAPLDTAFINYGGIKMIGSTHSSGSPVYNFWYEYQPITQGRYGHQMFEYEKSLRGAKGLYILGGATLTSSDGYPVSWVIEDYKAYPATKTFGIPQPFSWDMASYKVSNWAPDGHITLAWSGSNWSYSGIGGTLSSNDNNLGLFDATGVSVGRAFHQAVIMTSPINRDTSGKLISELSVIGGYVNNPTLETSLTNNNWFNTQNRLARVVTLGNETVHSVDGSGQQVSLVTTFNRVSNQTLNHKSNSFAPRADFIALPTASGAIVMTSGSGPYIFVGEDGGESPEIGTSNIWVGYGDNWVSFDNDPTGFKGHLSNQYIYHSLGVALPRSTDRSIRGVIYMTGGFSGTVNGQGSLVSDSHTDFVGPFVIDAGSLADRNQSTIAVDKPFAKANGTDVVTVTVTLKKTNGDPPDSDATAGGMPWVKLAAERPLDDIIKTKDASNVETTASVARVDSTGKAVFTVTSTKASIGGPSHFQVYYDRTSADVSDQNYIANASTYQSLVEVAEIDFQGGVSSFTPKTAAHGDNLKYDDVDPNRQPTIQTYGTRLQTETISSVAFYKSNPLQVNVLNDKIVLDANGADTTVIEAVINPGVSTAKSGIAVNFSTEVDQTESSFSGFVSSGSVSNTLSVATDSNGKARATFRAGRITGPQVILVTATVAGQECYNGLLLIKKQLGNTPAYTITMSASRYTVTIPATTQSEYINLSAVLKWGGISWNGVPIEFVSDSNDRFDSLENVVDGENGLATAQFKVSSGSQAGVIHIMAFAQPTPYDFTYSIIHIVKNPNIGASAENWVTASDFGNRNTYTGENQAKFSIATGATSDGAWDMQVTINAGTATYAISPEGLEDLVVSGAPPLSSATITRISPNSGTRGDNSYEITLTGALTHWYSGATIVSFTPVAGVSFPDFDPANSGITVSNVVVNSLTELKVTINISDRAKLGYWNVEAITTRGTGSEAFSETASMVGNLDFFVKTLDADGYFLDLQAVPSTPLLANSVTTAVINGVKGRFNNDPNNPQIDYLSGQITFANPVTGGGTLSNYSPSALNNGTFSITYTVDNTTTPAQLIGHYHPITTKTVEGKLTILKTTSTSNLIFTIVLQAGRAYGSEIAVYVKPVSGTTALVNRAIGGLSVGTNNTGVVSGLPTVALTNGQQYFVWVKTKHHLASSQIITAGNNQLVATFNYLRVGDLLGTTDTAEFANGKVTELAGFNDNQINIADIGYVGGYYGQTGELNADVDNNREVNIADIGILAGNYLYSFINPNGASCGSGFGAFLFHCQGS